MAEAATAEAAAGAVRARAEAAEGGKVGATVGEMAVVMEEVAAARRQAPC